MNRHHNWKGGLAQHCLGVCNVALALDKSLPRDSIIIAGILHDVCKASKLYVSQDGVIHHNSIHIKGHGCRSIRLLDDVASK